MTCALKPVTLFEYAASSLESRELGQSRRIGDVVAALQSILARGESLTRRIVSAEMSDAFGGSDAQGAWAPRDAYDACEGAVVIELVALLRRSQGRDASELLTALRDLQARGLIAQTRRSGGTDSLHQFSTPPALGWLAARAAGISASDTVLEPSAGTGLLAAHAIAAAARVLVNEVSASRRAVLSALDLQFFGPVLDVDAAYLRALYPGPRPSVVLMNPPFGAELDGRAVVPGSVHVAQAFAVLQDGGRLATILGSNEDPIARPDLFAGVLEKGVVRASLPFAPGTVHACGTDAKVRLVVFDRVAADGIEPVVSTDPLSVDAALAYVDAICPRAAISIMAQLPAIAEPLPVHQSSQKRTSRAFGGTLRAVACEKVLYEAVAPSDEREVNDSAFQPYSCKRMRFPGAQPHPDPLVESVALRGVQPPDPTYEPLLPAGVVSGGILSDAQLEAVVYAGQAHEQFVDLYTEDSKTLERRTYRRGYFLGDSGGVGKGRTLFAMARDSAARGRKRILYISETESLIDSCREYWECLGGAREEIVSLNRFRPEERVTMKEGIIYCTYATLRSESKKNDATRLAQLIAFAPELVIFDEAHNLGRAIAVSGARGRTATSQQGRVGLALQEALPDARIVYASATGSAELHELAYAPRLGLWGPDTSFPTRKEFIAKIGEAGLAGMEICCRDMVALGVYCARALSNAGIRYDEVEHPLNERQLAQYAAVNEAWRAIVMEIEKIIDGHDGRLRGAVRSQLYGAMQRCYNAMLISFKLPTVLAHARAKLDAGNAVVFQLTSTNEAVQERAMAARAPEDDLDELDLSPIETIRDFLERAFPTKVYVTKVDSEGKKKTEVMKRNGAPVLDPEAVAIRDALVERIATLSCPDGPLELINDFFGADSIAEVTGRTRRPVHRIVKGKRVRVMERRAKGSNLAEIFAFRDGNKTALVFSEAGGSGQSYHADRTYGNTRPRTHYLVQCGWKVKRAVQGLFRTHRTNQVCCPEFFLCTTDVPGEKRFIATIARAIDQLGAMTHGQRDAAGSQLFSGADNLEGVYGKEALVGLLQAVADGKIQHLTSGSFMAQTGLQLFNEDGSRSIKEITMQRMLNRLLAMDLDAQGIFMDHLQARLRELVEQAKINGTLDTGVQRITPLSLRIRERDDLFRLGGAVTTLLTLDIEEHAVENPFESVVERVREYRRYHPKDQLAGFYARAEEIVAIVPALASETARRWRDQGVCFIYTPFEVREGRGHSFRYEKWESVPTHLAETRWRKLSERAPLRKRTLHGIVGAMLPVWNRLPSGQPVVYRATTDEGEALLMRVVNHEELGATLRAFGRDGGVLSPEDAIDFIHGGAVVTVNGWNLKLSRVNGQERVEIEVPENDPYTLRRRFEAEGVLVERISYRMRFFLPSDYRELGVLEALVGDAPITQVAA
jgi:hypothetical protein